MIPTVACETSPLLIVFALSSCGRRAVIPMDVGPNVGGRRSTWITRAWPGQEAKVPPVQGGTTVCGPTSRAHIGGMPGFPFRRATSVERGEPKRAKLFTVVVLEDEFSGALAYALQRALREPAAIRAVRIRPSSGLRQIQPPVPCWSIARDRDFAHAVKELSAPSDLLVVQAPATGADEEILQRLVDLRRDATSPLIEVSCQGEIVRVCGMKGWSYSAAADSLGVHDHTLETDSESSTACSGA